MCFYRPIFYSFSVEYSQPFFFILGQSVLYNLHTQKNKWNTLANANIKSMKLDKALSIRIGQLIITNCTVTDGIIEKRAKLFASTVRSLCIKYSSVFCLVINNSSSF